MQITLPPKPITFCRVWNGPEERVEWSDVIYQVYEQQAIKHLNSINRSSRSPSGPQSRILFSYPSISSTTYQKKKSPEKRKSVSQINHGYLDI